MTNVNNFAIIGHLTADAEEFNIGNNTYVSFRVAVNRGQNKDASFIPVRAPKKFISDTLRAKLTKGASVLVSGRFESGHYEKDGQKKFYDYLSAATIQHDVNGGFSEGLLMGNLTADVVTRNTEYMEITPYPSVRSDQWNTLAPNVRVWYASSNHEGLGQWRQLMREGHYHLIYINGIYSPKYSILPLLAAKLEKQTNIVVAPRGRTP